MKYTFEQEQDQNCEDFGKWFVIDEYGFYINEDRPFDTKGQAERWIPDYEDEMAESAWYRSQQDGYTKGEFQDQQAKNQRLK